MAKKIQTDENGYRKFGIRDKIAYAAGDLGCNMSFSLKGTVQTFWLVFMMLETGLLSAATHCSDLGCSERPVDRFLDRQRQKKVQIWQVQKLHFHWCLWPTGRWRCGIPSF